MRASLKFSFFFFFLFFSISVFSQEKQNVDIFFRVPDLLDNIGKTKDTIPIYIDNYNYEIFGFQFVLISDRPDLVTFDFSDEGYITNNTLVENFELFLCEDPYGDGSAIWFYCIADFIFDPGTQDGIFPQQGGTAVMLPININPNPDTNLITRSTIEIYSPFDFSDRYGNSIGMKTDTTYDTTYYNCGKWLSGECVSWYRLNDTLSGYDSVSYDTVYYSYLDTTTVKWYDGSVSLKFLNCDLNLSAEWDIEDLVCMVDFMFYTIDSEVCKRIHCDVDNSNNMDIADLVYVVEFMFNNGPPIPDQ